MKCKTSEVQAPVNKMTVIPGNVTYNHFQASFGSVTLPLLPTLLNLAFELTHLHYINFSRFLNFSGIN